MFSKEKTKAIILPVLAGALGVFLVTLGGTLAPRLSPLVQPTEMAMAANPAADGACQAVWDASEKAFSIPTHFYFTHTGAGRKSVTMESIYVDGAIYSLVNGKWFRTATSPEDMKSQMVENRKNITNVSCHEVRDESVNGESATLYSVHSETARGIHDSQIWISKSKKLILREETDAVLTASNDKGHASVRFDYNNVQAPKVWSNLGQ
jgi:uncharacterized protein YlzI (FlbEa/FlbD family)